MLWTSAGPVVVIKYIVDQRRSDLAHQVCCGPVQVRAWPPKYAVDQCRSGFGSPSMLWTSAGPFFLIIQYVVVQCKSGFGPLNMLWTSTGPILLIKYIVDQRRSDLARQVCCGPAQVPFCSSNMLWTSAGPVLAYQVCCRPAQVRFSAPSML